MNNNGKHAPRVLFVWDAANPTEWKTSLSRVTGDIDFRVFPDVGAFEDIDYVMTWMPPIGLIGSLPNLKAIFSIGAGVSHILRDPGVPRDVPIIRLTDEALSLDMALHAAHWVLHFHRGYHTYLQQQQAATWLRHAFPPNEERRVGILGLGAIGQVVANTLLQMNFKVAGWSRTKKNVPGVESFAGNELASFLGRTEILVSVLPPTPETANVLNAETLGLLPKGAFIINIGRGDAINDADLLAALDGGHIAAAALDVFKFEPLPVSDPYWKHPKVFMTPHAAGPTSAKYGAKRIAENILAIEAGSAPYPIYDWDRGY